MTSSTDKRPPTAPNAGRALQKQALEALRRERHRALADALRQAARSAGMDEGREEEHGMGRRHRFSERIDGMAAAKEIVASLEKAIAAVAEVDDALKKANNAPELAA